MKSGRKHLLTGAQGEGLARKPVRLCHDVIRGFMHHFGTAVSKKNVRRGVTLIDWDSLHRQNMIDVNPENSVAGGR